MQKNVFRQSKELSGQDEILKMAKEAPPLIFGREPTGNALNFDEILSSMGVSDLNIGSDDSEDN